MSTLIPNRFSTYELTAQEALQGAVLTTLQKHVLQNHLANAAMEQVNLEYDALNPTKFAQEQASLKGQIDAYSFILDSSDVANDELNNPTHTSEV